METRTMHIEDQQLIEERLRSLENPLRRIEPMNMFASREITGFAFEQTLIDTADKQHIVLGDKERIRLDNMLNVLRNPEKPDALHPDIEQLVLDGKLTVGLVKPKAYEGLDPDLSDQEAADMILSDVTNRLDENDLVVPIPVKFGRDEAYNFYRQPYVKMHGRVDDEGQNISESIVSFISSGPATFLLIYREEGDAVEWWRKQMGATFPSEAAPDTLRGKYAFDVPNNKVHGSDSRENALKEVDFLRRYLQEVQDLTLNSSHNFPEEIVHTAGIAQNLEEVLYIHQFFPRRRRAINGSGGFEISLIDERGAIRTKNIKQKKREHSEKAREGYLNVIEQHAFGVSVPEIYGHHKDCIYEEFVEGSATDVLDELGNLEHPGRDNLITQLAKIAYSLDKGGFKPGYFVDDLLFSSKEQKFYFNNTYVSSSGERSTHNLDVLVKRFPLHIDEIESYYLDFVASE